MGSRHCAAVAAIALLAATAASAADSTTFLQRQAFDLASGERVIDDYENANYQHVMTDAAMSAVLGETDYFTYGGNVVDYNNIMPGFGVGGSKGYCSLCYGSFRLSFDTTSMSRGGAVHGVGLDLAENGGVDPAFRYAALVTFGDGSTASFDLPFVAEAYPAPPDHRFWGITSDAGIRSVDFISHASSGPERTYLIIDNLTLAAAMVPERSTLALMLAGLGVVGVATQRRRGRAAAQAWMCCATLATSSGPITCAADPMV
jgi:hypothetical protein